MDQIYGLLGALCVNALQVNLHFKDPRRFSFISKFLMLDIIYLNMYQKKQKILLKSYLYLIHY